MKRIIAGLVTVLLVSTVTIYNQSFKNKNIETNDKESTDAIEVLEPVTEQTDIAVQSELEENHDVSDESPKQEKETKKSVTSSSKIKKVTKAKAVTENKTTPIEESSTAVEETPKLEESTEEKQNSSKKEVWEELGMTKDQYYNEPLHKWNTIDFKSLSDCESYASENIVGQFYTCRDVVSASGRILGFMLDVED